MRLLQFGAHAPQVLSLLLREGLKRKRTASDARVIICLLQLMGAQALQLGAQALQLSAQALQLGAQALQLVQFLLCQGLKTNIGGSSKGEGGD